MDIAYALDRLVPGAIYYGSLTANTQEAYEAIHWEDERPKPEWAEVEATSSPPEDLTRRLKTFFETELTLEQQADLAPLKAAVKIELEQGGREEVVRLIIERAGVPPELENVKAQMLRLF